jgi:radical SAM superfamily enzyme YgiQ (UPF0313 family)
MAGTRRKVKLVQRACWELPVQSMPLSAGYMKAMVDSDSALKSELDVELANFHKGHAPFEMVSEIVYGDTPDVLAFSVMGWNYRQCCIVAEAYRQAKPDGWVIFGGPHTSYNPGPVFAKAPQVDVIVNGEGEATFHELMTEFAKGTSVHELDHVLGISFRRPDGEIVTTPDRPLIQDLDAIPSPFLSGALPLLDGSGRFLYDVALMESNRGCPYKCSFCFWGQGIGQKPRCFSIERLAAEVELFARLGVVDIVLCDANFAMLKQDEEFVELLVKCREKYGFPRNFEANWAKNKNRRFYGIARRMKAAGLTGSFSLALQSLNMEALTSLQRRNMKINEFEDLAQWLFGEGFDSYIELVWGCPGETYDSFIEGYDRVSRFVSKVATYSLHLIPNTDYYREREKYGIKTVRDDDEDYEIVVSTNTMTFDDNRRMLQFMFWSRVVAEHMLLRYIWAPLRKLAGITQSQVLLSLDGWFQRQTSEAAGRIQAHRDRFVLDYLQSAVQGAVGAIMADPMVPSLLRQWWSEEIEPRIPEEHRSFLSEVIRYDLLTRPIVGGQRPEDEAVEGFEIVPFDGERFYRALEPVGFDYDVPAIVQQFKQDGIIDPRPAPRRVTLYYKVGFSRVSDNHEFLSQFVGKTLEQVRAVSREELEVRKVEGEDALRIVEEAIGRYDRAAELESVAARSAPRPRVRYSQTQRPPSFSQ